MKAENEGKIPKEEIPRVIHTIAPVSDFEPPPTGVPLFGSPTGIPPMSGSPTGVPPMSGPRVRSPRFSPMPLNDQSFPPSPNMFPFTTELFGTEAFPHINDPVDIDICPSPNPLEVAKLTMPPGSPGISPLPSPSIPSGTPRLTEADADLVDIWFFRNRVPEEDSLEIAQEGQIKRWDVHQIRHITEVQQLIRADD